MSEHDEDDKRDEDTEATETEAAAESDADDETTEDSQVRELDEDEDAAETEAKPEAKKPAASKSSKLLGNLVFVLGFLATLGLGYYVGQWVRVKFGDKPTPENTERYRVELRGDEPQKGPDDALVTIIEFADFQCPYCAQSVEPLHEAMSAYEGDVRLIYKHYPLPGHRNAAPAAYASWAAHQQDDFWWFHDRLFESKGAIDDIPAWVKERGLDAKKFGGDMESKEAKYAVDNDMLSGSRVGVSGTPAFYVNGHLYRGKRSAVDWRKIIEGELEYAKDVVDDGVARGEVYEHLMKDALDRQAGAPERGAAPKRERRPGEPDDTTIYKVPIEGRPAKGPDTALVTIVEFADYHCPYCSEVKGDIEYLLERYPKDVRLVYVQRPLGSLHPKARDASKAAIAMGMQGKFWEAHDKLFLRRLDSMAQFEALAEELDIDVEKFRADYDSDEVAQRLDEDQKLAEQYNINGTPAFFINGRYLSGAQSYAVLEGVVKERLAEAKKLVADGTAPSEVYATLMADAATSVEE
jgi:protein-disulfide isomerase